MDRYTQLALADLIECLPGAVFLPASAVAGLWDHHGVTLTDLIALGGIAAAEQPPAQATTASPSGKPVEHVGEGYLADDERIRFVWLRREQSSEDQRLFAIGQSRKDEVDLWAIEVGQLTPEQLAKFSNRVCEL